MKSMSRGWGDPAAVISTMLSPQRTTTEPPACLAHFPVSTMISLPPTRAVSRTNGIRVLYGGHVAGRGFVAWSLCPTARRSPRLALQRGTTLVERLDGTIKPARFQRSTTLQWQVLGSLGGMAQSRPKEKIPDLSVLFPRSIPI